MPGISSDRPSSCVSSGFVRPSGFNAVEPLGGLKLHNARVGGCCRRAWADPWGMTLPTKTSRPRGGRWGPLVTGGVRLVKLAYYNVRKKKGFQPLCSLFPVVCSMKRRQSRLLAPQPAKSLPSPASYGQAKQKTRRGELIPPSPSPPLPPPPRDSAPVLGRRRPRCGQLREGRRPKLQPEEDTAGGLAAGRSPTQ